MQNSRLFGCRKINYNICPYTRNRNRTSNCVHLLKYSYLFEQHIKNRLRPGANFKIVGYSFGAMVALEIVRRLESEGRQGSVWLIDGAPDFLQGLSRKTMNIEDEKDGFLNLQIQLIQRFMDLIWPQDSSLVIPLVLFRAILATILFVLSYIESKVTLLVIQPLHLMWYKFHSNYGIFRSQLLSNFH